VVYYFYIQLCSHLRNSENITSNDLIIYSDFFLKRFLLICFRIFHISILRVPREHVSIFRQFLSQVFFIFILWINYSTILLHDYLNSGHDTEKYWRGEVKYFSNVAVYDSATDTDIIIGPQVLLLGVLLGRLVQICQIKDAVCSDIPDKFKYNINVSKQYLTSY
jgi:hypothetical protein